MTTDRPDAEATETSPALRDLVRGTPRGGPSEASIDRMAKRLVSVGVLQASSPAPAGPARASARDYKLGGLALAAVAVVFIGWRLTQKPPSSANTVALATATAPEAAAPSREASSVEAQPRPESSIAQAAPRAPIEAPANKVDVPLGERVPSELDLMKRAEASFATDPARTLAIVDEHARAYPHGQFAQEREVLAVEALARLGRKEEAIRRAREIVQRFPRTPYAARLEAATGEPLNGPR